MKIHQQTDAGTLPNEDRVWTGEGAAIVLDGTSGLTDRQFFDAPSDGCWFVDTFLDVITEQMPTDRELTEVAATAIERVDEQMRAITTGTVPATHELPAAAGVILRWNRDTLEYFVLGDCTLLVETQDGMRTVLGEGPRQLDQQAVDRMIALREQHGELSYRELRERLDPLLIEHRKQQNQPDGYWMLGFDPEAVEHAHTGQLPREHVQTAVAFTDGFEPIHTVFDGVAGWESLVSSLTANGVERAIRVLRAFEAADPQCRTYPRMKPADDVGIVMIDCS